MLETIFGSILTAGLTGSAFVICLLVALALGALVAAVYMYKNTYTQSMAVTLALLPAMVQVIILLRTATSAQAWLSPARSALCDSAPRPVLRVTLPVFSSR